MKIEKGQGTVYSYRGAMGRGSAGQCNGWVVHFISLETGLSQTTFSTLLRRDDSTQETACWAGFGPTIRVYGGVNVCTCA